MSGSFSAGLSGLNANSAALSVIGNNLANINTIGFKASTVQFGDLVSQNVGLVSQTTGQSGQNPAQVGLGVGIGSVSPVFTQGSIEKTGQPTNVAIQGNGFFVLGSQAGQTYTRAGDFSFNSAGALVAPDGQYVLGYTATDPTTGKIITTGQPGNVTVPPGVLRPPVQTTLFSATTNLNANAAVNDTFATSVQVYDSLGTPHVLTMTYQNTGPGAWTYALTADPNDVTGGTVGTPVPVGNGTMTFNGSGILTAINGAAPANVNFTMPTWKDGATSATVAWGVLDANASPLLSSFSSPSETSSISQNGAAAGMIDNITITADGSILASFGAGQSVVVAQLALASFNNPKGLVKLGANQYGESQAAGLANIGAAGTGGRGTLIGSALEQSNVDIAEEFTRMILAQRGYQANSKTITVSDELLVDTLNLKR
jgi:flagellar hook protein FlgE